MFFKKYILTLFSVTFFAMLFLGQHIIFSSQNVKKISSETLPEKWHITTFTEKKRSPIAQAENLKDFKCAQKGIQQVVLDTQAQKFIDTQIIVRNKLLQQDMLYAVKSGLPENVQETIFLMSPDAPCEMKEGTPFERMDACRTIGTSDGFNHDISLSLRGGVSAFLMYKQISYGLVNGTAVIFDAPFRQRALINGGLSPDVEVLRKIYYTLIAQNPQAKIVLIGGCSGGTAILNLLAQEALPQLAGVIVEAPPSCLLHAAERVAEVDFWFLPAAIARTVVIKGLKLYFPSYEKYMHEGSVLDADKYLTKNKVPMFFGRIEGDRMVAKKHLEGMAEKFGKAGNQVYMFAGPSTIFHKKSNKRIELKHGFLIKLQSFQNSVNAFCKKFGFSHDEHLAQRGADLEEKDRDGFVDILPAPEERD